MPENSGCTPGGEFKATDVRVQALSVSQIKLDGRNSRTHSAKQIRQIANSIIAFGFTNPLLVNENAKLIAGEGRLKAAQLLGFAKVPAIVLAGLSPARQRALAIADNKIAENAGWDRERLAIEIPELTGLLETEGLDVSILGFAAVGRRQFGRGPRLISTGPSFGTARAFKTKRETGRPTAFLMVPCQTRLEGFPTTSLTRLSRQYSP
jgi:ParB/Sulfiredoxin domain